MWKGLSTQPLQGKLWNLRRQSAARMHSPEPQTEREHMQEVNNQGVAATNRQQWPCRIHTYCIHSTSQQWRALWHPSPSRAYSPSPVLSATEWSRNQVREQPVPPVVNPDTWPAPILWDEREKIFIMAAENGAAVKQPNLHQRVQCQAETIPHLVKNLRAQCHKKCQLYTWRHKKMELPPDNYTTEDTKRLSYHLTNPKEKIWTNHPTAGRSSMLSLHNPDPTGAWRLACWSCKAQYHLNCMMCNCTKVMRTKHHRDGNVTTALRSR